MEKLINLLTKCGIKRGAPSLARQLISGGVILPRFSIGQTVYALEYSLRYKKNAINPYRIASIELLQGGAIKYTADKLYCCNGKITYSFLDESKTVFATEAEAIEAVAERIKNVVIEADCALFGLEALDNVEEASDAHKGHN